MIHVIQDDCLSYLDRCEPVKTIFADPPDNLGLEYDGYSDKLPTGDYERMLELLIVKAMRKCKILWLSYYHKYDLAVGKILYYTLKERPWNWQKVIWRFTFGQYTDGKLANGHRPMVMLWRQDVKPNYDNIRVMSERMRLGDTRAAGLRIPDDVWEIPRVTGNSSERRSWHPTQHPEELMERILLLSGHPVLDCFAGTGTTGRVAKRLGYDCTLIEQSATYCSAIRQDLGIAASA